MGLLGPSVGVVPQHNGIVAQSRLAGAGVARDLDVAASVSLPHGRLSLASDSSLPAVELRSGAVVPCDFGDR